MFKPQHFSKYLPQNKESHTGLKNPGSLKKKKNFFFFFFFAKLQKHTYTYNSLQLKWTLIAVKHQQFLFLLMQINNLMQM